MFNLICGCLCFVCGVISYLDGNNSGIIICVSGAILNFVLAAQQRH